ncbi:MAG: hypothetical protein ACLP2Q_22655 [Steroidobacteraceae bacterium]|jgi:hypothetical protein
MRNNSPASTDAILKAIYEEIMWLAKRPGVSASKARSWYTHVRRMNQLMQFSGKVSRAALAPLATIQVEHYKRIQTGLTQLVERHLRLTRPNAAEFIRFIRSAERVHIVTFRENYEARMAGGNYRKAGIELVPWRTLSFKQQERLWKKMIRANVANALDYKPEK